MKSFVNEDFMIIDSTIIVYGGNNANIKVPMRFGDMDVLKVGRGAFRGKPNLKSVILPPTLAEIHRHAFGTNDSLELVAIPGGLSFVDSTAFDGSYNIENIVIYDLEVSENGYNDLMKNSIMNAQGFGICKNIPHLGIVENIALNFGNIPARDIPIDIPCLFCYNPKDEYFGEDKWKYLQSDDNKNDEEIISIVGTSDMISQIESISPNLNDFNFDIYKKIKSPKEIYYLPNERSIEKTVIFTFNDSKTVKKGDKYIIQARLKKGRFFFNSWRKESFSNFYTGKRCYLSSNEKTPYSVKDVVTLSKDFKPIERMDTNGK